MKERKELSYIEIKKQTEDADDFIKNILLKMPKEQKIRAIDILTGMSLSSQPQKTA